MAFTPTVEAAITRLSTFYNGNAYSSENLGGMDDGGWRINFIPSVQDFSLVANAIESEASDAETARTGAETAQGLAETAQSAAETAQGLAEDARDDAEAAVALFPTLTADSYLKANSGGTAYENKTVSQLAADVADNWIANAPSGAVIKRDSVTVSSTVSTTSTDGADVISLSYTPVKSDSILEIEVTGQRLQAYYDYGAAEADGYVRSKAILYKDIDFIAVAEVNSGGRSGSDGVFRIGVPLIIRRLETSGSTASRTYKLKIFPDTAGHTAEATAASTSKILLTITEYAV